jgi:acyl carrier protein
MMMFSSKVFLFILVLAAASTAVTSTLQSPVDLGDAENYVILTKSGISTLDSSITGDIGVSPIAATGMTGFGLELDVGGVYATSPAHITGEGKAYASNYGGTTPADLTTAVSNMETAYTDAAGRAKPGAARMNLNGGLIPVDVSEGGSQDNPLTPGVYTFDGDVTIADTLYFDGDGDADSVFIIQIAGNLEQAADVRVELTNYALAKNIFWQIAGDVKVLKDAHMQGIILVFTDVLFETGSSLSGRVLAQTHCALQADTTITTQAS